MSDYETIKEQYDEIQRLRKLVEQAWRDGYKIGRGIGRLDGDVDEAWDRSVCKQLLEDI